MNACPALGTLAGYRPVVEGKRHPPPGVSYEQPSRQYGQTYSSGLPPNSRARPSNSPWGNPQHLQVKRPLHGSHSRTTSGYSPVRSRTSPQFSQGWDVLLMIPLTCNVILLILFSDCVTRYAEWPDLPTSGRSVSLSRCLALHRYPGGVLLSVRASGSECSMSCPESLSSLFRFSCIFGAEAQPCERKARRSTRRLNRDPFHFRGLSRSVLRAASRAGCGSVPKGFSTQKNPDMARGKLK